MFGDKDNDGFFHGESGGLSGYVPSNMVAEIPVDDEYLKHLLMQQGFLPVDHTGITSDSAGYCVLTSWQNSNVGVTGRLLCTELLPGENVCNRRKLLKIKKDTTTNKRK